jgi:hypothetical protein
MDQSSHPKIEAPLMFNVTLYFINHMSSMVSMIFELPAGLYPEKERTLALIQEAQKEGLKTLKIKSKDLTWRLPHANEFILHSTGGAVTHAFGGKYQEPYTVKVDLAEDISPISAQNAEDISNAINKEAVVHNQPKA